MNRHLYAALEAAGRIRSARWSTCPTCRTPTITGLDDDTAARPATCDPTPINQLSEALAAATGRPTYFITIRNRHAYLDYRDHWRIRGRPADTTDVLAEHRCGAPLPAAPTPPATTRKELPDEPPF